MRIYLIIGIVLSNVIVLSCSRDNNISMPENALEFACKQTAQLSKEALKLEKLPRSVDTEGKIDWANPDFDWTEGFLPGTCWYLYEFTRNEQWKKRARTFQNYFKDHRFHTLNHDLGFIFLSSYGKDFLLTSDEEARHVLIDAGNSLLNLYNPVVGCIQSWNTDKGWASRRGWEYPVTINTMMNLELLFELSSITGNPKYQDVAVSHADKTLENHFRDDCGSYHMVDYDTTTGRAQSSQTVQGYAHESSWARGQAWGLYGFTVCYRYTKDVKYLDKAVAIANYILNHPNLPDDNIPYWDYNAPRIPDEPRDASAAAITASALIELSTYSQHSFLYQADNILQTLSSLDYRAEHKENSNFILMHSVGSIPHGKGIDTPSIYADYYFVEALIRSWKLDKKEIASIE